MTLLMFILSDVIVNAVLTTIHRYIGTFPAIVLNSINAPIALVTLGLIYHYMMTMTILCH